MRFVAAVIACLLLLPVALDLVAGLLAHVAHRRCQGQTGPGLAIFVESIRWLGVRWGMRRAEAGLRLAGFEGELLYWRWHAGWRGWLVLPAIVDAALIERQSRKLADFIAQRRLARPHEKIFLLGYSSGGFVAIRALELLDEAPAVDGAAVLAGAFDPRRDLSRAARRVQGGLVVSSSAMDWLIVGLGTLVFGGADRRHGLSIGMLGPIGRGPSTGAEGRRIITVRWRPGLVRLGHLGGHFSSCASRFIAGHVAPAMGVRPCESGEPDCTSGRR